jgi:hypothetical protein
VVLVLYQLLKAVHRPLALLQVMCFLAGVPLAMRNELHHFAVLLLLHGSDYLGTFSTDQLPAQVPLLLNVHEYGIDSATIFWGLWRFPIGYLVFRSGLLARVLGILLIIGGVGYRVPRFAAVLFPNYSANLAVFTFWGELLFPCGCWLKVLTSNSGKNRHLNRPDHIRLGGTHESDCIPGIRTCSIPGGGKTGPQRRRSPDQSLRRVYQRL